MPPSRALNVSVQPYGGLVKQYPCGRIGGGQTSRSGSAREVTRTVNEEDAGPCHCRQRYDPPSSDHDTREQDGWDHRLSLPRIS
jgi:hypothetical protein